MAHSQSLFAIYNRTNWPHKGDAAIHFDAASHEFSEVCYRLGLLHILVHGLDALL